MHVFPAFGWREMERRVVRDRLRTWWDVLEVIPTAMKREVHCELERWWLMVSVAFGMLARIKSLVRDTRHTLHMIFNALFSQPNVHQLDTRRIV